MSAFICGKPHIDYILAAGVYAELYVGDRRYIVRESLQTLERDLAGEYRVEVLNLDHVDQLGGNLAVVEGDGAAVGQNVAQGSEGDISHQGAGNIVIADGNDVAIAQSAAQAAAAEGDGRGRGQ